MVSLDLFSLGLFKADTPSGGAIRRSPSTPDRTWRMPKPVPKTRFETENYIILPSAEHLSAESRPSAGKQPVQERW